MGPNRSFNPNPLRSTSNMADRACHVVGSTTQVGLTQALGLMRDVIAAAATLILLCACVSVKPTSQLPLPNSQSESEAAGHVWSCRGVPGKDCPKICVAQTSDAGSVCTTSRQCQGRCIAPTQHANTGVWWSHSSSAGCQYYLDDKRNSGDGKLCYD